MAQIHPFSVNQVRCTTIRTNGKIRLFYPGIRMGFNKSFVTNATVGSITALINPETGIVETDGYNYYGDVYEYHPWSNLKIRGFEIPEWNELVEMLTNAADHLPTINYVGWDVVLSDKGWCIMEGNAYGAFASQLIVGHGQKPEFEELIGWKPEEPFWWQE